jgi:DNA-binding protein YbaB
MPSFSDIRNSFKFQREAKKVQSELKHIHVEAEAQGVKVVVSAGMEVVSVEISPTVDMNRIGALLTDALNRALKRRRWYRPKRCRG